MPSQYPLETRKRDGVPTLYRLAAALCSALTKFAPIITAKYPDNAALLAALVAAQAACSVLVAQLDGVRDYGA